MNYLLIIIGLLVLIIAILVFKFIKNLIKSLVSLLIILVVISVIIGGIMYFDTRNMIKGIKNKENKFFLDDNGFITGFSMQGMNSTDAYSSAELAGYYDDYAQEHYQEVLQDSHMMLVFNLDSLADSGNQDLVDFLKGTSTEFEVEGEFSEELSPDTVAFMALVLDNVKNSPLYFVDAYKKGNLTVYPEPLTLKLLKAVK